MRLLSISYWSGKDRKDALVLLIGIDGHGRLIGLRSDKLSNADIKKLRDGMDELNSMEPSQLAEHLSQSLASYKKALVEMKRGRYEIVMEYDF